MLLKRMWQSEYFKLSLIFIVAILIRGTLAFSFEGTGDTGTWRFGGTTGVERKQLGMGNGTVYDGDCPTICSNWPPLTFHYMTTMRWISVNANPLGLLDAGFYKFIPFLSDSLIVIMIFLLARQLDKNNNPLLLAAIYAFHPIALFVGGYHGQRDTIWVFFTLLSIWMLRKEEYLGAGMVFAIGSAFKIPALFFSPLLFFMIQGWRQRVTYAVAAAVTFLIVSLPELVIYYDKVFEQVFLYPGWSGWWGLSAVIQKIGIFIGKPGLLASFEQVHRLLMYLAVFIANVYFGMRVKNYIVGILGVILTVFVFTPPFASQYLIWILPFLLLMPKAYDSVKVQYSIWGTLMAFAFYNSFGIFKYLMLDIQMIFSKTNWLFYPMDVSIPVWIISVILLKKILSDRKLYKQL